MYFNPFRTTSLLGLDIQPEAICLVQVKKIKQRFHLVRAVRRELNEEIFCDAKVKHWNKLCMLLTEFVEVLKLRYMITAVNLPTRLIRMHTLQLPSALSDAEIRIEIDAYLSRELPKMADNFAMDFIKMPVKNAEYKDVLFAVTAKDYLMKYVACMDAAGLQVRMVDVDIYVLMRCINFFAKGVNAFLYLSHYHASLVCFDETGIRFQQNWHIQNATELNAQFKNRLQIYRGYDTRFDITKIVLCGTSEFKDAVKEAIISSGLEIYTINPFHQMIIPKEIESFELYARSEDFLIACGLAMLAVPKWCR